MPKTAKSQEPDPMIEVIAAHAEGVGLHTLMRALGDRFTRRTLQRRHSDNAIRFGLHPLEFAAWQQDKRE
ncbi:MAG TPA: hypothetical protein PKY50_09140 [Candidatus Competibacter sp.]|nr:hypothetical protein [Candidatus Competibacter sp.]